MNALKIAIAFLAYAIVSNMDYQDELLTHSQQTAESQIIHSASVKPEQ